MAIDLSALSNSSTPEGDFSIASSVDDLLLAALERGGDSLETGRYLVTFNEGQESAALKQLRSCGIYGADSRDFAEQTVEMNTMGDAGFLYLSEVNAALISASAFRELGSSQLRLNPTRSPPWNPNTSSSRPMPIICVVLPELPR